jgi:uncharacterized protein
MAAIRGSAGASQFLGGPVGVAFGNAGPLWALSFWGCRADIRGMRDPMEPHHAKPCPICGRPSVERFRPFCSGRCADVDLGRWFSGSYAIAADDGEKPDASEPEDD